MLVANMPRTTQNTRRGPAPTGPLLHGSYGTARSGRRVVPVLSPPVSPHRWPSDASRDATVHLAPSVRVTGRPGLPSDGWDLSAHVLTRLSN
jgi:hypothetical protein